MKIPILRQIDKQDIQEFIDFWSKLYPNSETLEKLYSDKKPDIQIISFYTKKWLLG
jgi:hypothetical protein